MDCVGHTIVVQRTEARRAAADQAPAAAAAAAAGAGADGAGGERPANELENRFGLLAKLFFVLMILCQVCAALYATSAMSDGALVAMHEPAATDTCA